MANAIGIDFATTYSCVGVFEHIKMEIFIIEEGTLMEESLAGANFC